MAHPLDTLQPGQWYEVPNSQLRSVVPVPSPPGSYGAVMNAWSGAAYDTKRDRLVVWGGGHGDYWGNELYAFDVQTMTWSRIWGPTPNAQLPTDLYIDEVNWDGTLIGSSTSTGYVDSAVAPSTWYTYLIVAVDAQGRTSRPSKSITIKTPAAALSTPVTSAPPLATTASVTDPAMVTNVVATTTSPTSVTLTWTATTGSAPIASYRVYRNPNPVSRHTYGGLTYIPTLDRFWASGGSLQGGSGGMGWATWLFDFVGLKWTRMADYPMSDAPRGAAYDPVTGHVFYQRLSVLLEYDPAADTWTKRGSVSGAVGTGTSAFDYKRRKWVQMGDGIQYVTSMAGTPPWTMTNVTSLVTGDTQILTGYTGTILNRPGLEYDPAADTIVAWVGGTDVYTFNVDTLVWTRVPPASTNTVVPTQGDTAGTFGRWRYIPRWDAFIGVNSIDGNVYFYKLARSTTSTAPPAPDTIAPSAPTNLTAIATSNQVTLQWSPSTDNIAVAGYRVFRNGSTVPLAAVTTTAYQNLALTSRTQYTYTVVAYDAAGNVSQPASVSVTTPAPDTVAPSAPSKLTAVASSPTQVTLRWLPSTDNVGVVGYRIFRNGSSIPLATVRTTVYLDAPLTPRTRYTYALVAYDAAGNVSRSATATVTTPADTTAPSAPANLTATAPSPTQVTLGWSPSTGNVRVAGYRVFRNSSTTPLATVTATSYQDPTLTPNTQYTYRVVAYDAAGNASQPSSVTVTTPAALHMTPPVVTITAPVLGATVSGSGVTLSANASDDVGVATVQFEVDGVTVGSPLTAPPYSIVWNTTTVPDGSHSIAAVARDTDNNVTTSTPVSVIVKNTGGADTQAPPVPLGVYGRAFPDRIVLQWSSSVDPTNPDGSTGSGLARYVIVRNGTVIGTSTTTLYDDSNVQSSATYTYQVQAQDRAGNVSASSAPYTITAAPPLLPSVAQVDIPLQQWIALPLPVRGALPGGVKHVMPSYNPDNGRIYFTGGDFGLPPAGNSYRQDTYSLSLLERWSNPENPNAGWRLEYPYCGLEGQVQPKHPDYVGFPWDSKRHVFWMVPGLMMDSGTEVCLNETTSYGNDTGFVHDHLMTFDPTSRTWAPQDGGFFGKDVNGDEGWQSVYDAATDSILRVHDDSVDTFALSTKTWTGTRLTVPGQAPGVNVSGHSLRLGNGYNALDPAGRAIYSIDPVENSLYRYRVGTTIAEYLGPLPALYSASSAYESQFKLVWDSLHNVLYWHDHLSNGFFAYHPDTGLWETLGTASNLPGIEAVASNEMVFDPVQNVLLMFGDVWGETGSPQAAARPYMFLYRYGY